MNRRIEWIDIAKAIGIILVVYGHVILGVHDAGLWGNTLNYKLQHSFVYTTHMPLFFFLSGIFAVKWVTRLPQKAIWQKIRTLLIPYFICGFIQAGIMQIFSSSTNNGQGLINALQLPFLPYAQFWFLYDLFFIFIFYYILVNGLKLPFKWIFSLAILLFLVSPLLKYWELWRIFYHFIFFILGTKVLNSGKMINSINPIISLIVFVLMNLLYFFIPLPFMVKNLLSFFVALSGILLIISISRYLNSTIVMYIGQNSMVIYLMHLIFAAGTRICLLKIGIDNLTIQIILGLSIGLMGPIITLICTKYLRIDKILF